MKQAFIALTIIAPLILAGCGNGFPTADAGHSALDTAVRARGCMTLMSFESTGGQGYEYDNASFYRMEYTAKIRIDDGCYGAYGNEDHKIWWFPKKFHAADDDANLQAMGYRLIRGGDVVTITGNIDFERKGKTWVNREPILR